MGGSGRRIVGGGVGEVGGGGGGGDGGVNSPHGRGISPRLSLFF